MTDISGRVRSLLELAEKATPGKWVVHGDGAGEEWVVQEEGPTLDYTNVYDIRLIAEMRNLVPALAQEWEAMRAALEELNEWTNRMPDAGFNDQSPRWNWWSQGVPIRDRACAVLSAAGDAAPRHSEAEWEAMRAMSLRLEQDLVGITGDVQAALEDGMLPHGDYIDARVARCNETLAAAAALSAGGDTPPCHSEAEWEAMRAALEENDEDYRALTVELAKAEKERDKLRALLQAGTK